MAACECECKCRTCGCCVREGCARWARGLGPQWSGPRTVCLCVCLLVSSSPAEHFLVATLGGPRGFCGLGPAFPRALCPALAALPCGIWVQAAEAWCGPAGVAGEAENVKNGGESTVVFFRSSVLKEFALGTTLAQVAFRKEKKLKPVTSQDGKMHDFGGDNGIYIVRVLSSQVTPA